jgi:hypothetical protein
LSKCDRKTPWKVSGARQRANERDSRTTQNNKKSCNLTVSAKNRQKHHVKTRIPHSLCVIYAVLAGAWRDGKTLSGSQRANEEKAGAHNFPHGQVQP